MGLQARLRRFPLYNLYPPPVLLVPAGITTPPTADRDDRPIPLLPGNSLYPGTARSPASHRSTALRVIAASLPPGVEQRPTPTQKLGKLYREDLSDDHHPPAAAAGHMLTAEEEYLLDVSGYIVLRGALSGPELAALQAPGSEAQSWEAVATSSTDNHEPWADISSRLRQLLGDEYRLDIAPHQLPTDGGNDAGTLSGGGASAEGKRLRYWDQHGARRCLGARIVLALDDAPPDDEEKGGLWLLHSSHKSCIDAPAQVLNDPEHSLVGPLLDAPLLQAGDALLLAGSLAWGQRQQSATTRHAQPQRLLLATFASVRAFPAAGYDVPDAPPPEWFSELSPAQQQVCAGRMTGQPAGAPPAEKAFSSLSDVDAEELFMWGEYMYGCTASVLYSHLYQP